MFTGIEPNINDGVNRNIFNGVAANSSSHKSQTALVRFLLNLIQHSVGAVQVPCVYVQSAMCMAVCECERR